MLIQVVPLSQREYDWVLHMLGAWWCLGDSLLSPPTALHVAIEAARIAA